MTPLKFYTNHKTQKTSIIVKVYEILWVVAGYYLVAHTPGW